MASESDTGECAYCGEELLNIDGEKFCEDCHGLDGEEATEFTHDEDDDYDFVV